MAAVIRITGFVDTCQLLLGDAAHWLRCRSFAGGLSRSMPDLWLTCAHFVCTVFAMGQPTRPTQPSIPPGSVNEWKSM